MKIDNTWKVCLWGHTKDTHTCSYVMAGFQKAFLHLGMNVDWVDDYAYVDRDWSKTLFISIEGDDKPWNMPVRDDCFYVLHNSELERLKVLHSMNRRMNLQVLTNNNTGDKINNWTYFDSEGRCLYTPWATNLLPDEIDACKIPLLDSRAVHWVGTFGSGVHGNFEELDRFRSACERTGVAFHHWTRVSDNRHIDLIRRSLVALAIVGTWQNMVGYIPCRIFKNISYGQIGSTNSAAVNRLFGNQLVFEKDTRSLFFAAFESRHNENRIPLMEFVKEHHTYVNRAQTIIKFANEFLGAE